MNKSKLDSVFKALSHPTRRAILLTLASGPLSVGELARPFKISEPAVIRHLSVLEAAELLSIERDGQIRRRLLNASPLKEAFVFVGTFASFWEKSFDRLDDLLEILQKEKLGEKHGKRKTT